MLPKGFFSLVLVLLAALANAPTASAFIDRDGNGVDDVWEFVYFGRTLTSVEAAADFSGDGHSNLVKSLFGVNPITPNSFPAIRPPLIANGSAVFAYNTTKGILYQAQTSADLQTWTNLGQPFEGLGSTQQSTAPASGAVLFFRLQSVTPRLDTDLDGLDNYEEFLLGTNPAKSDTDADGLTDLEEFRLKYYYGINVDPLNAYTVPGVKDGAGDADHDGVSDIVELRAGSNPQNSGSYPAGDPNVDTDGNGLPDAWEMKYFGHLGNDPAADPDGDGLTNLQEYRLSTYGTASDPTKRMTDGVHIDGQADHDGDGVLDVWELEDGANPNDGNSYDLSTNYVVLRGLMQHLAQWGFVADPVQFAGTVLRATAIGFETAQQTQSAKAYGVVNEVSGFTTSGSNYVASRYLRFRKGVQYKVEMLTTSNNLPFVSGRFFWTSVGNSDEPNNKVYSFTVDNRQRYRSDSNGNPIPVDGTISPNPDVNNTYFTQESPGQGGPDTVLFPTGKVVVPKVEVVRETQPGSGIFATIQPPGGGAARLPLYRTDSGANLDEVEGTATELHAKLTQNLSNGVVDSMMVNFRRGSAIFSGLLTETTVNSGVFRSAGNTFTLIVSPLPQTNNVLAETLQVSLSSVSLGLSNALFTLNETSAASLNFVSSSTMTLVDFAGPLDPSIPDTISVQLTDSFYPQTIEATLTETGPNTRVFTRASGDVTVTINSLSGTNPAVVDTASVTIRALQLLAPTYTVALTETAPNSLEFSNIGSHNLGNVGPESPTTNGQGVFYVQIKGLQDATPVTLRAAGNNIAPQTTLVPGTTDLLRTSKLTLLEAGDTFADASITTLQAPDGTPNISAEVYDSTVSSPTLLHTAFFGRCMPWAEMPDGQSHLTKVRDIVTKKLGWTASVVNQAMTKAAVLAAVPKNGLWYSFSHGLTTSGTNADPFLAFAAYDGANPFNWKTTNVKPTDVSGVIGTNQYQLVFLNSCLSTDTKIGSQAMAMHDAFKAKAYVGWDDEQNISEGAGAAYLFFEALNGVDSVTGLPLTVANGVSAANSTLGPLSHGTTMTVIGDDKTVVDLTA